jgi:mono/diheme cytochrome c family protein
MRSNRLVAVAVVVAVGVYLLARGAAPTVVRQSVEPPPANAAAHGRQLYAAYGCAMCHGADAKGGVANLNAESEGKVPGLVMVKAGYLEREVAQKILDGAPHIGKADPSGPVPPYRMPGWRGRMTREEATDLARYLMSLYPKEASEDKWR